MVRDANYLERQRWARWCLLHRACQGKCLSENQSQLRISRCAAAFEVTDSWCRGEWWAPVPTSTSLLQTRGEGYRGGCGEGRTVTAGPTQKSSSREELQQSCQEPALVETWLQAPFCLLSPGVPLRSCGIVGDERQRWVRALEHVLKPTGRWKHLLLDIKVFQIGIALFAVACAAPGKLTGVQKAPWEK